MTLRKFLNLKILRDNVIIYVAGPESHGFSELYQVGHLIRNYTVVEEEVLIRRGKLDPKYLDYEIKEIWASRYRFKAGIVLQEVKHK